MSRMMHAWDLAQELVDGQERFRLALQSVAGTGPTDTSDRMGMELAEILASCHSGGDNGWVTLEEATTELFQVAESIAAGIPLDVATDYHALKLWAWEDSADIVALGDYVDVLAYMERVIVCALIVAAENVLQAIFSEHGE